MATAWDYIRHAVNDVDSVNADLMHEVLRIVGGLPDRPLTNAEVSMVMREVDTILNLIYGLDPQAAERSVMFRTLLRNTDATAEGPLRSFFAELQRDATKRDPLLWGKIETAMRNGGWGPGDRMAEVYRALTGPHNEKMRLLRSGYLDPQRRWVPKDKWTTQRGYRLSDRVWRNGRRYRRTIDRELKAAMREGMGPITLSKRLETLMNPLLLPERYTAGGKIIRRAVGADGGSAAWPARTLARTEMARMHHEAVTERVRMMPKSFPSGVSWNLSSRHVLRDVCDEYATQTDFANDGLPAGVFPVDQVPVIPHPACMCSLSPWVPTDIDIVDEIAKRYGF